MPNEVAVEETEFTIWAREELESAGFFDNDSDYDGMLGPAVMDLVYAFSGQGHSGVSAGITAALFSDLAARRPLGEITNDPDEWEDVSEQSGYPLYQNKRDSACFSHDLDRYYSVTESVGGSWVKRLFMTGNRSGRKMHLLKRVYEPEYEAQV